MQHPDQNRNQRLVDGLAVTLTQLPDISVHSSDLELPAKDSRYDAVIGIDVAGKQAKLIIEAKNEVFPRDVRAVIWRLRHMASTFPVPDASIQVLPVIAAASISQGAKELLRSEQVGYFEEGGSLYLSGHSLYVLLDKPSSETSRKTTRAFFSGSRSRVVHALLNQPHQWLSTNQLAKICYVSPSTASVVLNELERFDWLASQGNGPHKERMLIEPGALLDAWAKHNSFVPKPPIRRFYVPMVKPEELLSKIDQVCSTNTTAYVITHEWGAQLYSPFLSSISQVRCRIFPNAPLSGLARELNA